MLLGYCRTSTADQNPDHQIDALLRNGVDRDNIHVDVASGAKASRPKLDLVMQLMREGDTLKVPRLDRLSRSVLHLVALGAELRERGIGLHVIERTTGSPPRGPAAGSAGAGRSSRPTRPTSPSSSTTPGRRPSSRSPTCSTCPVPRCTGTSTRPRPFPASRRRPPASADRFRRAYVPSDGVGAVGRYDCPPSRSVAAAAAQSNGP